MSAEGREYASGTILAIESLIEVNADSTALGNMNLRINHRKDSVRGAMISKKSAVVRQ